MIMNKIKKGTKKDIEIINFKNKNRILFEKNKK